MTLSVDPRLIKIVKMPNIDIIKIDYLSVFINFILPLCVIILLLFILKIKYYEKNKEEVGGGGGGRGEGRRENK